MKHQQPHSSPIPSHILPLPSTAATLTSSTNESVILATSSSYSPSPSSSYSNDRFTIPKNRKSSSLGGTGSGGSGNGNGNGGRVLCSDRKGFFDHLRPKSIVISSCRVTILQAAQVLSTYITDQLEYETKLDEQLNNDEITHLEYETKLIDFEENEWKSRFSNLFYSSKIYVAIGRFHLLALIIRSYESLLYNIGQVDIAVLDRFTKDTFASAVRKSKRLKEYDSSVGEVTEKYHHVGTRSEDGSDAGGGSSSYSSPNVVTSRFDLGKQMFFTCLYANAITFLSDLTVQQCILMYGYYKFFVSKQRERKLKRLKEQHGVYEELKLEQEGKEGEESDEQKMDKDQEISDFEQYPLMKSSSDEASISTWMEDEKAIMMLSFFRKSAQATVTKSIGLVAASFGGAIGSMFYPGWGTLFGTQMGDAAVGAILDDE